MKWIKKDVIYKPSGDLWWAKSHAMIPTPILIDDNTIRLYLSSRDKNNISRIGYIDVDSRNPRFIKYISSEPVLDIGNPGCFDDNGILVTSILKKDERTLFLYYAGFEICHNIRYRLLTGMAISTDGGNSFTRVSDNPILERTSDELYFRGGPFVIFDDMKYKMWYVGGSKWIKINDKEMPIYEIKYLESNDGLKWNGKPKRCVNIIDNDEHGFGRPFIIKLNDSFRMFYSIRKISYGEYRLGFADLNKSENWDRKDNEIGLNVSNEGWDCKAIMYLSVINCNGKTYGFYNGNNFGETGIGFAELLEW